MLDTGYPFTSTKYTAQRSKKAHMQELDFRQLHNFNLSLKGRIFVTFNMVLIHLEISVF